MTFMTFNGPSNQTRVTNITEVASPNLTGWIRPFKQLASICTK